MGSARPVPLPPLPRQAACHAVTRGRLPSPALRNLGVSGRKKKRKSLGAASLQGKRPVNPGCLPGSVGSTWFPATWR